MSLLSLSIYVSPLSLSLFLFTLSFFFLSLSLSLSLLAVRSLSLCSVAGTQMALHEVFLNSSVIGCSLGRVVARTKASRSL